MTRFDNSIIQATRQTTDKIIQSISVKRLFVRLRANNVEINFCISKNRYSINDDNSRDRFSIAVQKPPRDFFSPTRSSYSYRRQDYALRLSLFDAQTLEFRRWILSSHGSCYSNRIKRKCNPRPTVHRV